MATEHHQNQEQPLFDRAKATAMGPYLLCEDPPHYLSAVGFEDIPEMVRVLNLDKNIYNGTASFQYPYLESHAHARVSRAVGYTTTLGYNTHWAMRTSPDGPLMGWIHAYLRPEEDEVHPETGRVLKIGEIGYWVSPEYVGKGYASRSARFVVSEIMQKEFHCDIVRAEAYVDNVGSRKVLESAGMECEVEAKTVFIPKLQEERVICCYAVHTDNSTKRARSAGSTSCTRVK
ncbi:hypothetical protein BGZ75_005894 [Mortierella antarctica]|nr:hypothetical protein BGZ67_002325 [Mortierella alpina]KAF9989576.1 hypothetical protein BGZ75_005894 [Mortierella antarctica]